ncbi:MAG: PQQ-binding-like beta-propeller repeat protein [Fuerstiella sp.]
MPSCNIVTTAFITYLTFFSGATFNNAALATGDPEQTNQWNRFRGPNGTGVHPEGKSPESWSETDYRWTIELAGTGSSSPVIWGSKIFIASSDETSQERSLQCIDTATGKQLWNQSTTFKPYKKHKNNSFASSTPCCDADHVYIAWHSKDRSPLIAYDHTGQKVWEYDLGPFLHGQGGATSPIIHNNLVIIAHDQKDPSYLLALDRMTGNEAWKVTREGQRACYSTPCIFSREDQPDQIAFSHCFEGIVGVDPATGNQLWHIDVFGRSSQRAVGSVIQADDFIVATSGAFAGERQLVAIKPNMTNEATSTATEAWRTTKQTPHVPTPLVYKDWIFLWSDQGIASCLEHATGKTIWKKRVGGNYFGSPICIDEKLYCIDVDGTVAVIAASDKYRLFGKFPLGQPSKSTPAYSNGSLYFRTDSKLFAL